MISYPEGTRLNLPDGAQLNEVLSKRIIECLERYEAAGQLDSVSPDQLDKLECIEDAALLATLKFLVSLHAVSEVFSFEIQQRASSN
jgi:hypothetical protein